MARLFVAGRPRTKGHLKTNHQRGAKGRPCKFWETEREELKAWMRTLGRSIQEQLGIVMHRSGPERMKRVVRIDAQPYALPVEVHCFFRFDRALSERAAAEAGEAWPSHASEWPTAISIGDEDTLRRAVLDALVKSGVIKDDSLSVGGMNYKRWCEPGEEPGVLIMVLGAPTPERQRAREWLMVEQALQLEDR